jgi:hypothetical protein
MLTHASTVHEFVIINRLLTGITTCAPPFVRLSALAFAGESESFASV